ncbi:MAG: MFS transporter, partial [Pseudomonadota bacterium]
SMGVILLIVSAGSIPAAGILDRLLERYLGYSSRPAIMGLAAAIAIPATVSMLVVSRIDYAFAAVGVFMFITATANALVPTMLQDLIPAPLRARTFAIWSFLVSIFSALGPLIAGLLSDFAVQRNLLQAITITIVPALVLSACFAASLVASKRQGTRAA